MQRLGSLPHVEKVKAGALTILSVLQGIYAVIHYFCNFNTIALVLLALQNAGFLVLMGYVQQQQDAPPGPDEGPRSKFAATHFLAATEWTKLILCSAWCVVEVLQDMLNPEAAESANETSFGVDADEDPRLLEKKLDDLEVDGPGGKSAFAGRDAQHTPISTLTSPGLRNGTPAPRFAALATARMKIKAVRVLMSRPTFHAHFINRMRHAIGLDEKFKEALLMIVPAIIYAVQGQLLILALQYLDPTVFQILYQIRILFLAVMMHMVLEFKVSRVRWASLVALMVGIILAQLAMQRKEYKPAEDEEERFEKIWSLEGTLAALAGAFLSSCSGVFMEYVFKKRGSFFTLTGRSIHLAFFSIVYFWLLFARDVWNGNPDDSLPRRFRSFIKSFFEGFTLPVWILVLLQAMGGILVGIVMRYCDNIVKSFSTAFAIVLSGAASVYLFNLPLEPMFLWGSLLVLASITVYSIQK